MIVVTAPTGNIGHRVVADLLAAGESLRLIVRDAGKLPDAVRGRVEVVEGSHGDAAVVERAFEGAEALFWLAPVNTTLTLDQAYLDFTRPAGDAIRRHRVPRVISVTALGRGTPWEDEAGVVTASIRMDDMLMASGAAFRGLAMPSFMDNFLRQAATIGHDGVFYGTLDADRTAPTTATRDIGAVAARLLADRHWSGQAEVPVLGPEDLSADDMAAILSDVIGRPVRYQQIALDAFKAQLLGQGVTASFAQGYVDMMRAKADGMDDMAGRAGTIRTATTFRRWCEDMLKPAISPSSAPLHRPAAQP